MSPRRHRRDEPAPRPEGGRRAFEDVEDAADGVWYVRHVAGDAGKTYRCPGCDQEVRPGVPHVVAWPAEGFGGAEHRRHWHAACWRARTRRAPVVQRSRNAPRYG